MLNKIVRLYSKHKEIALYLVFGGATTVLNFVVYILFSFAAGLPAWLSNAAAWVVAVAFAFVTNKVFVFKSKTKGGPIVLREAAIFFAARVASGAISTAAMLVFVDFLAFNEFVIFTACQVFVIVFNYVSSKWLVFRR